MYYILKTEQKSKLSMRASLKSSSFFLRESEIDFWYAQYQTVVLAWYHYPVTPQKVSFVQMEDIWT